MCWPGSAAASQGSVWRVVVGVSGGARLGAERSSRPTGPSPPEGWTPPEIQREGCSEWSSVGAPPLREIARPAGKAGRRWGGGRPARQEPRRSPGPIARRHQPPVRGRDEANFLIGVFREGENRGRVRPASGRGGGMHRVRGTSGDALARGTGLPPDLSPRNTPAAFWSVSFVFPPAATRTVALVRPLTRRGGEGHRRGGGGGAGPVQGPGASGPHALVLPKSNTYIWEPVAQPPFEAQTRLGRRARRGGEGLEAGGRDGSFSGALACRPEPSIAH